MTTNEGKGRPTPKRKEAESKRKVSTLAPVVTKDQKRASKALARQSRVAQRAAYLRGEESALPARDRGPARRYVRNFVDSRRSTGEYFLPIIFVVLVLTLFPYTTLFRSKARVVQPQSEKKLNQSARFQPWPLSLPRIRSEHQKR